MKSNSCLIQTLAMAAGLTAFGCSGPVSTVDYIDPDASAGKAGAAVVGDHPLAFTQLVFPSTGANNPVASQVEYVLAQLASALGQAGTGFDHIVRVNVYATEASVVEEVQKIFAERFQGEAKPTVAFMTGQLPVAGVAVGMDAVAAVPGQSPDSVVRHSQVAVLPAGPVLFISGRAENGPLQEATRATLGKLESDLAVLGLGKDDVVQVKAFISPIASAEVSLAEIRAFFEASALPSIVAVEWHHRSRPVEIEIVAAAPVRTGAKPSAAIEFLTPPGDSSNPFFTRLVRVNRGKLIFTSGLYGESSRSAEAETREIMAKLRSLLQQAGSDFDHMAKATYYVTDDASSTALNTVRRELYNPERPPAASKITVSGSGREGKTTTLEMIAVAP